MANETIRWFAGIDWGSKHHQVCIRDATGRIKGERAFPHGGAGLRALCDWLGFGSGRSRLGARRDRSAA
jgi:Transposase